MSPALAACAVWLPEQRVDAATIAAAAGLPEGVVRDKLGIRQKCRAPEHIHPSDMAIAAARRVLADRPADAVDLLIWVGSEHKDYPVWSAGIYVQEALGLRRAWAFDAAARCSSMILGLKLAHDLMIADANLQRILLCGGHRTGDLVNYRDPNARFLYNLADGGVAVLVERGGPNPLGPTALITDGSFSRDVVIPVGGTRQRPDAATRPEQLCLTVPDVDGMRERLADRSLANFTTVIERAAGGRPIDFLALVHMKRSAHDELLSRFGLAQTQSIYLADYGHFGAPDQILALGLAERAGLLAPGQRAVLASAGIGYTWAAAAVTWQAPCFQLITGDPTVGPTYHLS